MSDLVTAYIGLGANLGDRLGTLRSAVRRLGEVGSVEAVSGLYETAPVGFAAQPSFLNAAVALRTRCDPAELVRAMLAIESKLGRTRSFPNAPRTIDLDVLLVGETVIDTDMARIPHPRLHERAFVVVPLADIAPEAFHPVLQRTVSQLRDAIGPDGSVIRVAPPGWETLPGDAGETGPGH